MKETYQGTIQEGRVQKGNINGMPTNPSPKDLRPAPPGGNEGREITKMTMIAFEKVQGIIGVIEIERASNPHRDKWVFAQYNWEPEEQECCVHGTKLRQRCDWCKEMDQRISMKEGRRAYVDGKVIEDCPYGMSAYVVSHHAWRLGWDTAMTEEDDQRRAGSP